MRHTASTAFALLEFGACVAAITPAMACSWLRHRGDPTQRMPGRWMRRLGRASSALCPLWHFRTEGDAPADIAHRAYVVVANHESAADPFLLSWLPWDMRWVAKEELFRLPILGWTFRFSGDIPLHRGDGDSVRATMEACRRSLSAGISIMMFPEGTRSKTGSLLPFKDGAFRLAIEAGVPILPIAIEGTRTCMQAGTLRLGRADATARVLAPIATVGATIEDVASVRDAAREQIQTALAELRDRRLGARASSPPIARPDRPASVAARPW